MKNYFENETGCNCSCGTDNLSSRLLRIINEIRDDIGVPLYLNSACRCPEYNEKVGGVPNSAHVATEEKPGEAVDIRCPNSSLRFNLLMLLLVHGIKRVGIYPSFIHADIDKDKPQEVIWYSKR